MNAHPFWCCDVGVVALEVQVPSTYRLVIQLVAVLVVLVVVFVLLVVLLVVVMVGVVVLLVVVLLVVVVVVMVVVVVVLLVVEAQWEELGWKNANILSRVSVGVLMLRLFRLD